MANYENVCIQCNYYYYYLLKKAKIEVTQRVGDKDVEKETKDEGAVIIQYNSTAIILFV